MVKVMAAEILRFLSDLHSYDSEIVCDLFLSLHQCQMQVIKHGISESMTHSL